MYMVESRMFGCFTEKQYKIYFLWCIIYLAEFVLPMWMMPQIIQFVAERCTNALLELIMGTKSFKTSAKHQNHPQNHMGDSFMGKHNSHLDQNQVNVISILNKVKKQCHKCSFKQTAQNDPQRLIPNTVTSRAGSLSIVLNPAHVFCSRHGDSHCSLGLLN